MKKKPKRVLIGFRVNEEAQHDFKVYAAKKKKTISNLLEEFVIAIIKIDKEGR